MAIGSITFGQGLASGIDWQSIVDALIKADSYPITQQQSRIDTFTKAKNAFGQVQSALADLETKLQAIKTGNAVGGKSATVTGVAANATAPFTATVDSSAISGAYNVQITHLAQAHRVRSNGVADAYSPLVNDGTITIKSGDNNTIAVNVSATTGNNSLQAVAAAINQADAGVVASIVQDGTNSILVVKSQETGTAHQLSITDTTNLGLNVAGNQLQAAQNAQLIVDGIAITSQSNTVTTAIPGVSLNLVAETTSAATLTVADDVAGTKQAIKDFVAAYNKVNDVFQAQFGSSDAESVSAVGSSSVFRSLQGELQSLLAQQVGNIASGHMNALAELGVRFADRTGTLEFNEATFDEAVTNGFYSQVRPVLMSSGSTTDGGVQYVSALSTTKAGTYDLTVTRAAERAEINGSTAIGAGGLGANEQLTVTLGSSQVVVNLAAGDRADAVVSKINAALTTAGLAATASNNGGRLRVTSQDYGSAQTLKIVSSVADNRDGASAGIGTTELTDTGVDVQGRFGDAQQPLVTGVGQDLVGASGTDAAGLAVRVYGTATGSRGQVAFSQGLLDQFVSKIDDVTDPFSGVIHSAQDGYDQSIKAAQDRIAAVQDRLAQRRELLVRQFSAAEQAIAQLNQMMASLNGK